MHIVIIGSGMAGITFAEELHKLDPSARLTVLTHETHGYYSRPMLSHGFSRDDVETKIILRSFENLRSNGIDVQPGTEVLGINRETKTVACLHAGTESSVSYDTLVLAPGSDAFIPPPFRATPELYQVINSLDDLIELRRHRNQLIQSGSKPRWAVIGGGLIGCEVASDLAKAGDTVVLFHALPRLMERQLVDEDSASLLTVLNGIGIDVRLDAGATGFERDGDTYTICLNNGQETGFNGIIIATGFKPRTTLAESAGLAVNRGILVNECLQTEDPNIFALGDAVECADGRIYAYVMPIRQQALWLGKYLSGQTTDPWRPPAFKPRAKVHGFTAAHDYLL